MTDITPSALEAALGIFDASRPAAPLSPADAALASQGSPGPAPATADLAAAPAVSGAVVPVPAGPVNPAATAATVPATAAPVVTVPAGPVDPAAAGPTATATTAPAAPTDARDPRRKVSVLLDCAKLRRLRHARLLSQQDLAEECSRRKIRLSIATIKRAETGFAVSFRTARELARFFDIPSHDYPEYPRMDEHKAFLGAARDTLMHIAAVSGTAAKRLRAGQSLDADLGFDLPDFSVLAEYQRAVGDRLRLDGAATRLAPDDLRDCVVWEVFSLTVRRAVGRDFSAAEAAALIGTVQAGLRGGQGSPMHPGAASDESG